MQITLVLHNIRSAYNVGAILRTAEGLAIARVVYSGYTPRYADQQLLPHLRAKLDHQIAKAALGAEKSVKQLAVDNLAEWLAESAQPAPTILGLENNLSPSEQSRRLILGSAACDHKLQSLDQAILILGEEVHGIPPEIRQLCNYFVEIPMFGQKESFNVSVATAIALWELSKARPEKTALKSCANISTQL